MGWLCCLTDERPSPSPVSSNLNPPFSAICPPLSSNIVDGAHFDSSPSVCCVLLHCSTHSNTTIAVQGGRGNEIIVEIVAASSAFKAKLSHDMKSALSELVKTTSDSGLFWIACEHALSKGDSAGHLAVALPNDQVLLIRACSWKGAPGIMIEWQQSLERHQMIRQAEPDNPPAPVSGGDQGQGEASHVAAQRAHELINDDRFPAALT